MLEAALHWETCRCVTRPMRQAIDVESPSWMLELMPPVGVLDVVSVCAEAYRGML